MPDVEDHARQPGEAASDRGQGVEDSAPLTERGSGGAHRPRIILVVGMHRSGTSLCAHVLNALGIDMADEPGEAPSNPKGHWERSDIVALHDRILELFDRGYFTSLHDLSLPRGWWADHRVFPIKREIIALLKLKLASRSSIGFKDPRTSRLLPLWQEILAELDAEVKFVLCLRNPVEVARSLHHRDRLPSEMGQCRWFIYMADIVDCLRDAEICTIEYERWFDEKSKNAAKLIRFLGLESETSRAVVADILSDIVDERLSHTGPAARQPEAPQVRQLYELVRRFDADPAARAAAVCMIDTFRAFQELYEPMTRTLEAASRPPTRRLLRGLLHAVGGGSRRGG